MNYIKMGDVAGENGDEHESFQWYLKGLSVARKQVDEAYSIILQS